MYDRRWTQDQITDAITATEALLQLDAELSFMTAFRIVALLHVAESIHHKPNKQFYANLNGVLQHSQRRTDLRRAAGIAE